MSTLTATFSQLRAPSTKTIVISLLQALAFAAALYVAALICIPLSEAAATYDEGLRPLFRWAWVVPIPFYAIGIGIKLAAEALGNPSIASNIWLRMPARVVFSTPIILLVACEIYYTATAISTSQDSNTVATALAITIITIIATLAVLYYYVNTLDGFKGKPVADALFTSLFPVMPFIAICAVIAVSFACVFAIAIALALAILPIALRLALRR